MDFSGESLSTMGFSGDYLSVKNFSHDFLSELATTAPYAIGNPDLSNDTSSLQDSNKTCIFNVSNPEPIVDDFSVGYKVFMGLLYGALGIFGIIGNVFILIILGKDWRQKRANTANLCLVNVTIIDLFYLICCHPLIMWNILREGTWRTQDIMCQLNGALNCMVYLIAIYSLSLISLERTLNITYPARPKKLTNSTAKLFIGCIWLFAFICAVLPLCGINKYVVYRNPLVCGPRLDFGTWQVLVMTGGLLLTFVITIWSQGFLLVRVLRYKRKQRSEKAKAQLRSQQCEALTNNTVLTTTTVISKVTIDLEEGGTAMPKLQMQQNTFMDGIRTAFTVFIVCSTYIVSFIIGAGLGTGLTVAYQKELKLCTPFVDLNLYMWTLAVTMYMLCFCANPYIYGLRNNDIKKEFRSMFAKIHPFSALRRSQDHQHETSPPRPGKRPVLASTQF